MFTPRWVFRLFVALFVFTLIPFLAHAESEAPARAAPAFLQSYILGVDDRFKVTVYQEPDLTGSYSVAADGTISMPLIGVLDVVNRPAGQVAEEIVARLKDGYLVDPSVSIEIERYRPFYILGEVQVPGRYDYVNHISALKAVAMAGGFTYRAKKKRIKVKRHSLENDAPYHLMSVYDAVMPGDVLIIEERFF